MCCLPGFKYQTEVLARLFQLVQDGEIHTPLYDPSSVPDPAMSNAVFLRDYVTNLLRNAFPHLQPYVYLSLLYQRLYALTNIILCV